MRETRRQWEQTLSDSGNPGRSKTAFVFAGGGSFGAVQVGMMQSLASHGVSADMVQSTMEADPPPLR